MKEKDAVVVKYLIANRDKEMNILNLAKGIGMDYKNAHSIVKRLEKKKAISIETFGKTSRIMLGKTMNPLMFEAENSRRDDILKDKNLLVMLNQFKKELKSCFYVLLLFGSYAKKTQRKDSDIDLMFIAPEGAEEELEKKVSSAARLLPLKLHCLVFSEKQFKDMLDSKGFNVGKEAAQKYIILNSIETYYDLIADR